MSAIIGAESTRTASSWGYYSLGQCYRVKLDQGPNQHIPFGWRIARPLLDNFLLYDSEPIAVAQNPLTNPPRIQPLTVTSVTLNHELILEMPLGDEQRRRYPNVIWPESRLDIIGVEPIFIGFPA